MKHTTILGYLKQKQNSHNGTYKSLIGGSATPHIQQIDQPLFLHLTQVVWFLSPPLGFTSEIEVSERFPVF